MNWLIPANVTLYNLRSYFADYDSIDWGQGNAKYAVGDIVYIYCTKPLQKIKYKCKVTKLNLKSSEIIDDKEYWLNQEEYEKS
jgi:5-methylcytosine-specific restriction protein A